MLMLSTQVSKVQDRLDALTGTLDVKDKRIQELEAENIKLRQTIAELDPTLLLQQVHSYKTALAEKEQQITDLSRTIDELTKTHMSTSFNRPTPSATVPSMS